MIQYSFPLPLNCYHLMTGNRYRQLNVKPLKLYRTASGIIQFVGFFILALLILMHYNDHREYFLFYRAKKSLLCHLNCRSHRHFLLQCAQYIKCYSKCWDVMHMESRMVYVRGKTGIHRPWCLFLAHHFISLWQFVFPLPIHVCLSYFLVVIAVICYCLHSDYQTGNWTATVSH